MNRRWGSTSPTSGSETGRAGAPTGVYLLLILSTLLWGAGPVVGKLALRGIPPITIGFLRFGLAAAILMLVCGRSFPGWRKVLRQDGWLFLALGIFGAFLNHLSFFFGLRLAPASHGAIIAPTTSPIWTMLLEARLGGERITRDQILELLLCMVGVVLVVGPGGSMGAWPIFLGDVSFVLTGMVWAVYSYLSKVAMRRMTAEATLAYGMTIGCVFLGLAATIERPWVALSAVSLSAWLSVLYLSVGPTLLAYFWWNLGIRKVGAWQTAVFSNLMPVSGVMLSWLILGERLGLLQMLGGGLAVVGVWVCQGPPALQAAWRWVGERLGKTSSIERDNK